MTLFPSAEILRRRADIGLIAVFFILVWLPCADTFLHLDRAAATQENRLPATFPKFHPSLAGIGKFLAGTEAYFADHFGFRRQLVRWQQRWQWKIFRDAQGGGNARSVLAGKGDWLFFAEPRTVNDIIGAMRFTAAELEGWRTLLTGRRDWLRERGIRYLLVIPPDKQSIYPEHLPDWLADRTGPPQRLDQFLGYMRAHSDVPILDLRATLLDAKKSGDIYLHTDTHWNARGAFAAYRRIVQEIASLGLPSTPLDAEAFDISIAAKGPAGDLAQMMGQEGSLPEKNTPSFSPKPSLPPTRLRMEPDLVPKKWTPGTEPRVIENPATRGKMVMFHDSFAQHLFLFLGQNFGRIVFVWQPHWNKPVIEREKPDIVVDDILQRVLIFLNPEDARKDDERTGSEISPAAK